MNHAWESGTMKVLTKIACPDSAITEPIVFIPAAAAIGSSESDDPGRMLDGCRQYL